MNIKKLLFVLAFLVIILGTLSCVSAFDSPTVKQSTCEISYSEPYQSEEYAYQGYDDSYRNITGGNRHVTSASEITWTVDANVLIDVEALYDDSDITIFDDADYYTEFDDVKNYSLDDLKNYLIRCSEDSSLVNVDVDYEGPTSNIHENSGDVSVNLNENCTLMNISYSGTGREIGTVDGIYEDMKDKEKVDIKLEFKDVLGTGSDNELDYTVEDVYTRYHQT